jgi:hypothetical protein
MTCPGVHGATDDRKKLKRHFRDDAEAWLCELAAEICSLRQRALQAACLTVKQVIPGRVQISRGRRQTAISNLDWMVSLFADFLESGTKNDETAYAPELLPIGWSILQTTLAKIPPSADVAEISNPMTYALNTARGRTISALFSNRWLCFCQKTKEVRRRSAAIKASVFVVPIQSRIFGRTNSKNRDTSIGSNENP